MNAMFKRKPPGLCLEYGVRRSAFGNQRLDLVSRCKAPDIRRP
jgi:hypothetical protein